METANIINLIVIVMTDEQKEEKKEYWWNSRPFRITSASKVWR